MGSTNRYQRIPEFKETLNEFNTILQKKKDEIRENVFAQNSSAVKRMIAHLELYFSNLEKKISDRNWSYIYTNPTNKKDGYAYGQENDELKNDELNAKGFLKHLDDVLETLQKAKQDTDELLEKTLILYEEAQEILSYDSETTFHKEIENECSTLVNKIKENTDPDEIPELLTQYEVIQKIKTKMIKDNCDKLRKDISQIDKKLCDTLNLNLANSKLVWGSEQHQRLHNCKVKCDILSLQKLPSSTTYIETIKLQKELMELNKEINELCNPQSEEQTNHFRPR